MTKGLFAVLAALGVVLGSLSFASPAHAVYVPSGHGYMWVDEPNG